MASPTMAPMTPRTTQALSPYELGGEQLGTGTYGEVTHAVERVTQREVAVKKVEKAKLSEEEAGWIDREIKILTHLGAHDNICQLLDAVDTPGAFFLILEYCDGGEMVDYIITQPQGRLREKEAAAFFAQIVTGVKFCHDRGVVHRDLKMDNILLTNNCRTAKVTDFGYATFFEPNQLLKQLCGSPGYAAPELISFANAPLPELRTGGGYMGPEVDIWSLGIVLFAMVTGALPFGIELNEWMIEMEEKCDEAVPIILEEEVYLSDDVCDLIADMLIRNPEDRLGLASVLNSLWLVEKTKPPPSKELLATPTSQSLLDRSLGGTDFPTMVRSRSTSLKGGSDSDVSFQGSNASFGKRIEHEISAGTIFTVETVAQSLPMGSPGSHFPSMVDGSQGTPPLSSSFNASFVNHSPLSPYYTGAAGPLPRPNGSPIMAALSGSPQSPALAFLKSPVAPMLPLDLGESAIGAAAGVGGADGNVARTLSGASAGDSSSAAGTPKTPRPFERGQLLFSADLSDFASRPRANSAESAASCESSLLNTSFTSNNSSGGGGGGGGGGASKILLMTPRGRTATTTIAFDTSTPDAGALVLDDTTADELRGLMSELGLSMSIEDNEAVVRNWRHLSLSRCESLVSSTDSLIHPDASSDGDSDGGDDSTLFPFELGFVKQPVTRSVAARRRAYSSNSGLGNSGGSGGSGEHLPLLGSRNSRQWSSGSLGSFVALAGTTSKSSSGADISVEPPAPPILTLPPPRRRGMSLSRSYDALPTAPPGLDTEFLNRSSGAVVGGMAGQGSVATGSATEPRLPTHGTVQATSMFSTALDDPTRRRLAAMFEDALEKSREGGGGHGRRGAVEDSTSSTHAFLRSSFVRGEEHFFDISGGSSNPSRSDSATSLDVSSQASPAKRGIGSPRPRHQRLPIDAVYEASAEALMAQVLQALEEVDGVVAERLQWTVVCRHEPSGVRFDIEVCRMLGLDMAGLAFRIIHGNRWVYKSIAQSIVGHVRAADARKEADAATGDAPEDGAA